MNFSSKDNLIEFIKEQLNVCLSNEPGFLNKMENALYTEIPRIHKNAVLTFLNKHGIRYEDHAKNCYWIFIDNQEDECS